MRSVNVVKIRKEISYLTCLDQQRPRFNYTKVIMDTIPSVQEKGPILVLRETWGSKPKLKCRSRVIHPARFLFFKSVDWTPDTEFISTCAQKLVWLQKRHREIGSRSDIKYNFIIGSDGYVYEGRGWDLRPDILGKGYSDFSDVVAEDLMGEPMSSKSYFIGFMDDDADEGNIELMVKARDALLNYGLGKNYIAKVHRIFNLYD